MGFSDFKNSMSPLNRTASIKSNNNRKHTEEKVLSVIHIFCFVLFINMTKIVDVWKPEDHVPVEIKKLLAEEQPNYVMAFLNVVQLLKIQRRTGWVDFQIEPCESIADHMYRMGITSMLIKDPKINRDKCVRIALVHDLAEALVGDITPFDAVGKDEKHRREWETIKYLADAFIRPYNETAAQEIVDDWLAYENISSPEARYVKDIDKFEMLVQCYEYERKYHGTKRLDQFWSAMSSIKTVEVSAWVQDLWSKRQRIFSEQA